jgi:hypothetical protein
MSESPRRVDLRLTIPAASPYENVAVEIAEKFAEYAGAPAAAARALAERISAALAPVVQQHPDQSIDLQMTAQGRELVVTARAGQTMHRATCPLPE